MKPPIINSHAHIFTSKHVPSWLARSFIWSPFCYLIHTHFLVRVIKRYYDLKWKLTGEYSFRRKLWRFFHTGPGRKQLQSLRYYLKWPITLLLVWLGANALIFLIEGISYWFSPDEEKGDLIDKVTAWLKQYRLLLPISSPWIKGIFVLMTMILSTTVRKMILFAVQSIWKFLKVVPSPQWKGLIDRYLLLARYAFYKRQADVFSRLKWQYPKGTQFVVLPMDMEYMGAGPVRKDGGYYGQLQELSRIKAKKGKLIRPFVFVDPRRMADTELNNYIGSKEHKGKIKELDQQLVQLNSQLLATKNEKPKAGTRALRKWKKKQEALEDKVRKAQSLFDEEAGKKKLFGYTWKKVGNNHRVELDDDTLIMEFIEQKGFSGFKIYPALGYYPFDERLLPLWKYAADNELPIMTHCVIGTIFYRDRKKYEWNHHEVFRQKVGDQWGPMELPQKRNVEFQRNFTHPMNYLCLLHEPLLRILVGRSPDQKLKALFGYNGPDQSMTHDLSHLKLCLAHFGGEEEWVRYLEGDRNYYADDLLQNRSEGLNLNLYDSKTGEVRWTALARMWERADWYSIICTLMLDYDHVYADLSYILSKPRIYPLLEETLDKELNPNLYEKVLFGTDFYMVRNHNSDKDLLATLSAGITPDQFDQIARSNPVAYLQNTVGLQANPVVTD